MQLDLATTSMLAGMMLNETPALNTLHRMRRGWCSQKLTAQCRPALLK
jgi:hypothetical protein